MLSAKEVLIGSISSDNNLKGELNNVVEEVYPELEDLIVIPKNEEQHFKSEKYGYNNVTVNAINLQEKEIIPSKQNQEVVADQEYSGLSKVTVSGDDNLISENIKDGINIFGVEGNFVGETKYNASISVEQKSQTTFNLRHYAKEIPTIDTSNITSMGSAFQDSDIEEIPLLNTSKVTNMENIFRNCSNLKSVPLLDTSKVKNMGNMFFGCNSLETVPLLNTTEVTDMQSMFRNCNKLKVIPELNTSNVTNMQYMFQTCSELETVPLLDTGKSTNVYLMFRNCDNLKNLGGLKDLGKAYTRQSENYNAYSLDLINPNLTAESLINIINNLYDLNLTYNVSGGGTLYKQKLTLGDNKSKLSEEQIAIATNKGWNVI